MYSHPQQGKSEDVVELRKEAGRWLRAKREGAGLSQRDLAARIGLEYYTFISQIESGRGRIPPDRYPAYARALEIDAATFARTLLRFYDPVTHMMIFADEPRPAIQKQQDLSTETLQARIERLERALAKISTEA